MTQAPGYWMNETSGVLRPAVMAYLDGEPLTAEQIAAMRAYLRQWIAGPWQGESIPVLRQSVDEISDRPSLERWLDDAADAGIDPL